MIVYNISDVVAGDMLYRIVKIYSNLECAFQICVTVHTIFPPTCSSGVNITSVFISMQCSRWTLIMCSVLKNTKFSVARHR